MKEDVINPDDLIYDNFSESDDFKSLDFTEEDGSDPLEIDRFIHTEPIKYVRNKISTIYAVKYEGKPVAYFTLSMAAVKVKILQEEDVFREIEFNTYPAMLVGHMGVDKKYRNKKVGSSILRHCLGLAQKLNEDIACSLIILHTIQQKIPYYKDKCGFKYTHQEGRDLQTMYRRI